MRRDEARVRDAAPADRRAVVDTLLQEKAAEAAAQPTARHLERRGRLLRVAVEKAGERDKTPWRALGFAACRRRSAASGDAAFTSRLGHVDMTLTRVPGSRRALVGLGMH